MTEEQQTNGGEQFSIGWGSQNQDKKPHAGDSITGKVVDVVMTSGGEFRAYPIVTLTTEKTIEGDANIIPVGTDVQVHCFHETLWGELKRKNVQAGNRVEITKLGKKSEGGSFGRGYEMYRVRTDAQPREFDWGGGDDTPSQRSADPPMDPAPTPAQQAAPPPRQTTFPPPEPEPAGAQFGNKPPFLWDGPVLDFGQLKDHVSRWYA